MTPKPKVRKIKYHFNRGAASLSNNGPYYECSLEVKPSELETMICTVTVFIAMYVLRQSYVKGGRYIFIIQQVSATLRLVSREHHVNKAHN